MPRRMRNQIVLDDLERRIRSGDLPAGTRLPTHRDLAREHGIALETATRIYKRLSHMGLIVGEAGRGTYVREPTSFEGLESDTRPRGGLIANLAINEPISPGQADELRQALKALAASGNLEAILYQEPAGGRDRDRRIVATYLLSRGIDVPPANVLITNGSQQGLDAALDATTGPGELIAIDSLSYPGMRMLAKARRHEFASIPVTPSGPDLDALEMACLSRNVRVIYTQPTMHNPLSWVLTLEQRERIVEIAREHGAYIIEDGTYAFLDAQAPPPIQTLAPERTLYVGSLSKNLATGLRFGFLVTPTSLAEALRGGLRASTYGSPSLVTTLGAGWIADGTVERHEAERRADAARRQTMVTTYLRGYDLVRHPSGYMVWLQLHPGQRMDAAAAALLDEGIAVSTAARYATDGHPPHALRIAIGTPPIAVLATVLERVRITLDGLT